MIQVNKVGHVVLNSRDVETSVKFYTEALGMEVVSFRSERPSAFLSFGTQHHDIALFQASEGAEQGQLGLNHIALQIEGGVQELKALHQRLLDIGVQVDRISDHGITQSVYFFDPDGNRLEIFCEMMEQAAAKSYLQNRGGKAKLQNLEVASTG